MWSGGISGRNRVRPAGKWAQGLTCQTAKTPACHIQFVTARFFIPIHFSLLFTDFVREQRIVIWKFFCKTVIDMPAKKQSTIFGF